MMDWLRDVLLACFTVRCLLLKHLACNISCHTTSSAEILYIIPIPKPRTVCMCVRARVFTIFSTNEDANTLLTATAVKFRIPCRLPAVVVKQLDFELNRFISDLKKYRF